MSRLHLNNYSKSILNITSIRNFLNSFDSCIVWDNEGVSESSPSFQYSFNTSFDSSDADLYKIKTTIWKPELSHYNPSRINGYETFRRDRNRLGEDLVLRVNNYILCKLLNNFSVESFFEITVIKFHQHKRKLIFLGNYKPLAQSDSEFIGTISN